MGAGVKFPGRECLELLGQEGLQLKHRVLVTFGQGTGWTPGAISCSQHPVLLALLPLLSQEADPKALLYY